MNSSHEPTLESWAPSLALTCSVAAGVSRPPGQLGTLYAGARHAEAVGEVAQRAGDGAPARAHRPAAHAGLAAIRRFLVDHQVERLDLGHEIRERRQGLLARVGQPPGQ